MFLSRFDQPAGAIFRPVYVPALYGQFYLQTKYDLFVSSFFSSTELAVRNFFFIFYWFCKELLKWDFLKMCCEALQMITFFQNQLFLHALTTYILWHTARD
jgi:hypothetical protein